MVTGRLGKWTTYRLLSEIEGLTESSPLEALTKLMVYKDNLGSIEVPNEAQIKYDHLRERILNLDSIR
jgi:hypothetical protein